MLLKTSHQNRLTRFLLALGLAAVGLLNIPLLVSAANSNAPDPSTVFHWVRSIYRVSAPLGVDVNEAGDVFVSQSQALQIYDPQGKLTTTIKRPAGKFPFYDLFQVRVDDSNNRVYAADFNANTVWTFDEQGKYLGYVPMGVKTKKDAAPYVGGTFHAYSMDYYNGKLYVGTINAIYVFDSKGKLVERFGNLGTFQFVNGLAIDHQRGVIYVADTLNRRVVAMTPTGKVLWTAGTPDKNGNIQSFFNLPRGLAVGPNGDIYVTDTFLHRIDVLSPQGKLVGLYGGEGPADGSFDYPDGIAIVPPPSLWQRFMDYLFHDTVVATLGAGAAALLIWRVWRTQLPGQRKALVSLIVAAASAASVAGVNAMPGLNQSVLGGSQPYAYVADHGNNRIEVFQLGAVPKPTPIMIDQYNQGFVPGALVPKGTSTVPIVRF